MERLISLYTLTRETEHFVCAFPPGRPHPYYVHCSCYENLWESFNILCDVQSDQLPKLEGARDESWDLVFALKRKAFGNCQVAKRFEQVFSHRYCRSYSSNRKNPDDHPYQKATLLYIGHDVRKCLVDRVAHRELWRKRANDLSTCRLEG